MKELLGERFNAELESVYKRAFTYLVKIVGSSLDLMPSKQVDNTGAESGGVPSKKELEVSVIIH